METRQKYLLLGVFLLILLLVIGGLLMSRRDGRPAMRVPDSVQAGGDARTPVQDEHQQPQRLPHKEGRAQEQEEQVMIINLSDLPRFVHHNFIELDRIARISKFRSGYGHDFSRGLNETNSCRSMKHYFEALGINASFRLKEREGSLSKDDWPLVKYFAPVSGTIIDMRARKNVYGEEEHQFILKSDEYPAVWFLFFHVLTKDGLHVGSKVAEGEFLGMISPGNSGEIGVSVNQDNDEQLVSFFEVIDDDVFSEYQARGVKKRNDFIISKQYRDEHPLICSGESDHQRFIGNWFITDKNKYDEWSMGEDNWVFLQ